MTAATAGRATEIGRTRLLPRAASALAALLAFAIVAGVVYTDDVGVFRPRWVVHPDETGMLFISKHLADTGSFVNDHIWYQQSPAHVPEGVGVANGRLVPQKALLGYVVYAGSFLVSDDGWQYVGPFFGLVAAGAIGWLVLQKTRNRLAGLTAAVAFLASSPVIMYASGLAFADIVAVAFYLAGVAAFQRHTRTRSAASAMLVGVAFGAAMLTRLDFFVTAPMAVVALVWMGRRGMPLRETALRARPGIIAFGLLLAGLALANWWLYGSPLTSGYPAGSWQSSPAGIGGSVFDFSPLEFAGLAWGYLFQIGLSCTALLAIGLFAKWRLAKWDATDALLVGFALFGLIYFLGKEGAYGTGSSWLVASYPRYLLPVYAAGVVIGVEGVFRTLRHWRWGRLEVSGALLAVALAAGAVGMHEAFTNERGVPYVRRLTLTHDGIRDVAERTPYPVLVSDINSKAVVDSYTITPRLLDDPEEITKYVDRELRSRRHVLLAPQETHSLYTGYVETIREAGYRLVLRRRNPPVYEVFPAGEQPSAGNARSGGEER